MRCFAEDAVPVVRVKEASSRGRGIKLRRLIGRLTRVWPTCRLRRTLERGPPFRVVSAILPLLLSLPNRLSFLTGIVPIMSGLLSSPSLSVPTLTIETSSSELKVRIGRTRSSSIVKVETVGEDSQEEGQDQNLYDNVNAEWVNRKGQCIFRTPGHTIRSARSHPGSSRRMDYTPHPHHRRKNCTRLNTRNQAGS